MSDLTATKQSAKKPSRYASNSNGSSPTQGKASPSTTYSKGELPLGGGTRPMNEVSGAYYNYPDASCRSPGYSDRDHGCLTPSAYGIPTSPSPTNPSHHFGYAGKRKGKDNSYPALDGKSPSHDDNRWIDPDAKCHPLDMSLPENQHVIQVAAYLIGTAESFDSGESSYHVDSKQIMGFLDAKGVVSYDPLTRRQVPNNISKTIVTRVRKLSSINTLPNQIQVRLNPDMNIQGSVLHSGDGSLYIDHLWNGSDDAHPDTTKRTLYKNECISNTEAMKWAHIEPSCLSKGVTMLDANSNQCFVPQHNATIDLLKSSETVGFNIHEAERRDGFYVIPKAVHSSVVDAVDKLAFDKLTFSDMSDLRVYFSNAVGSYPLCSKIGTKFAAFDETDPRIYNQLYNSKTYTVGVFLEITFCIPRWGPPVVPDTSRGTAAPVNPKTAPTTRNGRNPTHPNRHIITDYDHPNSDDDDDENDDDDDDDDEEEENDVQYNKRR